MSIDLSIRKKTAQLFMHSKCGNYENELCIICLENSFKNYNYELFTNYYKNCRCKFYVHQYCFNEWYKLNPICPICRKTILSKDNETICKKYINKYCNIIISCFLVIVTAFLWFYIISVLIEIIFTY